MKKVLLTLSFILLAIVEITAQCTPDPTFTDLYKAPAGSRHDTSYTSNDTIPFIVLPYGYVGQNYSEVLYFNIPTDTTAYGNVVTINYVQLDSVLNMPTGFSVACDQPGCKIYGGSSGCLTMSGIPQQNDSIELEIAIVYNVTIAGLPTPLRDTIGEFYFVSKGGQPVGVEELTTNETIPKLFPNPANDRINIEYQCEAAEVAEVTLTNMLGRVVATQSFDVNNGSNTFTFDVQSLNPGVYLYTVRENHQTFTGRFTISR